MRPDFSLLDLPPDPPSSGTPVTIFYDCEFTALSPDADLLSIGFTACDFQAELYIELSDAEVHRSSDFVKDVVLPLFGTHNPEVLTRDAAATRIEAWFDDLRKGDRDRPIIMVSDNPWDWTHFIELLPTRDPAKQSWASESNVFGRLVSSMLESSRQHQAFADGQEAYFSKHEGRHHALVDARALKAAYWESRLS